MEIPGSPDPSQFIHIRMVLSMVVSLSIARLLSGLAKFVQHPGMLRVYSVHLLWSFFMMVMLIHFWWWEFALSHMARWNFYHFIFLVCYASLLYLLCALLFPDSISEYKGYRDYFLSRRKWFFGILAGVLLMDVADTWIKGSGYFHARGLEYPLRIVIGVGLCIAAATTGNRRFHLIFAVAALIYNISWILRLYRMLG